VSPRENASNIARTTCRFSCDIACAVFRHRSRRWARLVSNQRPLACEAVRLFDLV
jgi:hypothetical protein